MSFWKTLQRQPRTISLFTNDIASNIKSQKCLQLLKGDVSHRFDVEIANRFPHVGPAAIHENFVPARPSFVAKADSKAGFSAQIQAHRPDVRDGPAEVCPEGTLESKGGAGSTGKNKLVGNEPADIDKYIIQRK
ncbi:AIF_collapsed_G0032120.mRNA.1.CDS.1 [Saccharomyces cerevisiae]|nr:AIF_collapsed_G0032120.mRNA.1.CDS.1 [Saccharomyces cerevisiae]